MSTIQLDQVDLLIHYMLEREKARINKDSGLERPWCDDKIISEFRFTNILRNHDRHTRYLIERIEERSLASPSFILMNIAIFRWTGTIDFYDRYGWWEFWNARTYAQRIEETMKQGVKPFTSAYVISNFGRTGRKSQVVASVLQGLWEKRDLVLEAAATGSIQTTSKALEDNVFGFGGQGFMTKEIVMDLCNSHLLRLPVDRYTWTGIGPGGHRGLCRIYGEPVKKRTENALGKIRELYQHLAVMAENGSYPESLPQPYGTLWLHDLQFVMCEFDKYSRALNQEGRPKRRYK